MRNKSVKLFFIVIILASVAAFVYLKNTKEKANGEIIKEMKPVLGNIQSVISTTGTVLPKNRLEIKPPVNGRVDEILVREGEKVKSGQTVAWMSSTERAAMLDAARGQGEQALKYWQEVYKPIPLIAPIDGEVIVAKTQPGQTVTTAEAVIVLSDQLIVKAQVDETDIGKIKPGLDAVISLDAYPDADIKAKAEHIYYESKTVNNVTIYEVDLLPENPPAILRSGMNATINFIEFRKENILLLPQGVASEDNNKVFVVVKQKEGDKEGIRQVVVLGLSDDKNVEVVSGISIDDTLLVRTKKYSVPSNNIGKNPFMPQRKQRSQSR